MKAENPVKLVEPGINQFFMQFLLLKIETQENK